MKKLLLISLAVLTIAMLIFTSCSQQAPAPTPAPAPAPAPAPTPQTYELKFAYWTPPPIAISRLGYEAWGSEIEDVTGGRIKIKFFGGGAMGAPENHYDLVKSGTADIANSFQHSLRVFSRSTASLTCP